MKAPFTQSKLTPSKPVPVRKFCTPSNKPPALLHSPSPLVHSNPVDSERRLLSNTRGCNCKKSNCLKLYCDCLSAGEYCVKCNCTGCYNNEFNEKLRNEAIRSILEKNPIAFRPKIVADSLTPISAPGESLLSVKHNKVLHQHP